MNKDRLREEIAEDEGCKYEVYLDHLGLPTCGIGHLITESDDCLLYTSPSPRDPH